MNNLTLPVTDIRLDLRNPRLKIEPKSQNEAIVEIYKDPDNKVPALLSHIVEYGLDPSTLSLVMEDSESVGKYIVLEGNRRIAALKILFAPEILDGEVSVGKYASINKLATIFKNSPIDEIECVLMKNREDADVWIELRHTGQNGGIGVVDWGAEQKARYKSRKDTIKPINIQVLDIVEAFGGLSESAKNSKLKVTDAVRRITTDSDVQKALGYQIIGGMIQSHFPIDQIAKGFTFIVEQLKTGQINTNDVHSKKNRMDYVATLPKKVLPSKKTRKPSISVITAEGASAGTQRSSESVSSKSVPTRDRIFPKGFTLSISHPRLSSIYRELRALSLKTQANTVGVLLRAFLEMSVDEFIFKNAVAVVKKGRNRWPSLSDKLNSLADYLEGLPDGQNMSKSQLRPIRKFTGTSHSILTNVDTLHAYIHDRNLTPSPSDLRAIWDNLQSFVERIWR